MDAAVDCFPERWYRRLHKQAKAITGALGAVRDRDVLMEALQAERATAPGVEWPGIDRLLDRLDRERTVARAEMEQFLADLAEGGLPGEVARRFGSAAAPPGLIDQLHAEVARVKEERQG
jgi:CHAD domain-containing protein